MTTKLIPNIDLDQRPLPRLRMSEAEDENFGAEWVDGAVIMTPPASERHVAILGFVHFLMTACAARYQSGIVRGPKLQRRHPSLPRRRMPDILFISKDRRHIIREMWLEGAPDLVVEIVSKDSVARDGRDKYLEYEAAGVREYWVIDPITQKVEAYALGADQHYAQIEEQDGILRSTVLPGFYLRPAWLWQDPPPNPLEILRELGVLSS